MTAIESINKLLDEVRPTLLLAGVPKECIKIKKRDKPYRIDACNRAFDWLHNLKMAYEFTDLIAARALLPEETWARYELFEIEGLREQGILVEAQRALLKKWTTKRPTMFKGHKKR